MNSLKLTEVEKTQIAEINLKVQNNQLVIENAQLKIEVAKNSITQLTNSANSIINQFCKLNGKDPNKIVNFVGQEEIIFQEEAKSEDKSEQEA